MLQSCQGRRTAHRHSSSNTVALERRCSCPYTASVQQGCKVIICVGSTSSARAIGTRLSHAPVSSSIVCSRTMNIPIRTHLSGFASFAIWVLAGTRDKRYFQTTYRPIISRACAACERRRFRPHAATQDVPESCAWSHRAMVCLSSRLSGSWP